MLVKSFAGTLINYPVYFSYYIHWFSHSLPSLFTLVLQVLLCTDFQ